MANDTKIKTDFHMRWMIRRDMPEVIDIERLSFPFPWSEEEFLRTLREMNTIGMTVEKRGVTPGLWEPVVGFVVYTLLKTRLHVKNFAVHPAWRRRGVGTIMAKRLVDKLSSERRTRITLDVTERNLDASLFFRQMGFRCESMTRGFYDGGDDALHMVYRFAE